MGTFSLVYLNGGGSVQETKMISSPLESSGTGLGYGLYHKEK